MYRKKFTKSALSGLVAVSMIPCVATPIFAESQSEEELLGRKVSILYIDEATNEKVAQNTMLFSHLDKDGSWTINANELPTIANYTITSQGDLLSLYGGSVIEVTVKANETQKDVIMKVQFVDETGTVVGGGDYFLPEGVQNYSVLSQYVPAGYQMTTTGDFMVEEGGSIQVNVEKIQKDVILNVQFVDENGTVVGGGDYFVPEGINNYSILEQYLPAGYEMTVSGDFNTANGPLTVSVKKIVTSKTINVVYVDENGKNLGGGDYIVDPDGDGIANYSELSLPEGYKLKETGDFFVEDGGKYTVVLDKIVDGTVVNVVFVDEAGNNLGGGDYRVDLDNDGVANYSELTLPAGYELIETGDFFVKDFEGKTNTITVKKISKGSIVNVVFVDDAGNNLGGGDYYIDADGDGIANYSEFALPEGYELITTGDFFVKDFEGKTTTITLQKIVKDTIINVVYVDEEGNVLGGGDFFVDPDGDGIANYSELTLPVGYELITTGDFFVENGASYTITLRAITTEEETKAATLNVKVVDYDSREVLSAETFTSADKGQADQTYTFVYGEDYQVNIPKGYKLIKDVEPADITVNYGSTMTAEFYVTKDEGTGNTGSTEEGNKEDSSKTDGVDTGVATALSASMAGVAASGIGILGLLRKKRNKK